MAGEQILVVEDQRAVAGALQMRLRGSATRSWGSPRMGWRR